eukprot:7361920-Alexandrium_andersonii.AAC.1
MTSVRASVAKESRCFQWLRGQRLKSPARRCHLCRNESHSSLIYAGTMGACSGAAENALARGGALMKRGDARGCAHAGNAVIDMGK